MGMYKKLSGFASVACFAAGFLAFGAAPSVAAPDPNFHIYIAYGQSNMGGTADAQSADKVENSRFKILRGQGRKFALQDFCDAKMLGQGAQYAR